MCGDENLSNKIDLKLVLFKKSKGLFGCSTAKLTKNEKSHADWWDSFGDDTPKLKQFAIRVLSLTCSSSGCERNWSAFEMVHSKRRNRLQQHKMNDLVYVMYNLKLSGREERKQKEEDFETFHFEDVDSDDEWITEDVVLGIFKVSFTFSPSSALKALNFSLRAAILVSLVSNGPT
ncbi:zf-BED domain-containing protein [Tanacetum coccineum]